MPSETIYTYARAHLATLCDAVTSSREPVIIPRRGAEDVPLVSASELRTPQETRISCDRRRMPGGSCPLWLVPRAEIPPPNRWSPFEASRSEPDSPPCSAAGEGV